MESRSRPWRVLDGAERPVALQPCENDVMKDGVERGVVRADPGADDRLPPGLGAARAVCAGRPACARWSAKARTPTPATAKPSITSAAPRCAWNLAAPTCWTGRGFAPSTAS